jgi:O-antigen biosynthesis protein WbqP
MKQAKKLNVYLINIFDVALAISVLLISSPVIIYVYFYILLVGGSPIFSQFRIGLDGTEFRLYKFRTMPIGTASVATHLNTSRNLDRFSLWLRKTKMDELPQLFNILKGEMSFVGPRPCLPNQKELIEIRYINRIFDIKPGITGWAQVNGIDMSDVELITEYDKTMTKELSLGMYFKIIMLTFVGYGSGDKLKSSD